MPLPIAVALLAGLLAGPPAPAAQDEDPPPGASLSAWPEPYPGVEPFAAFAGWPRVALDRPGPADLASVEAELRRALEAAARARPALPPPAELPEEAPDARLAAPLAPAGRAWWCLVPAIVDRLAPFAVPGRPWSEADHELAARAAEHLARLPEGIELDLSEERTPEEKREELARLGAWFRQTIADPARFAAMCPSLGEGPFAGLPGPAEPQPGIGVLRLDRRLELRLVRDPTGAEEPFALQALDRGTLLWSRVLSAAPGAPVRRVELARGTPRFLGEHGWLVTLAAERGDAPESILLFLAPGGAFRFYSIEP